ncbi:5-methyltetrahydropteroyltriglutamate--homocysteine S-methyltransferase [Halodesulfovibrio aestuarii]|uniref:5-methyltetrahydropteroyltriglutamate-- homocysteine S-methyltransferase n=1 Tax=Halodesulfovibrio aestuarii TaxID=126333 RepID=UPI003522E1BD
MEKHILGFPRIGAHRELKKALEAYWRGVSSTSELLSVSQDLKERHWRIQHEAGLSYVSTGDFSFYDHVLDTTAMLGAIPERFDVGGSSTPSDLSTYFRMARGDASRNIPPMEMTKWFNTNYHYIVPEITASQQFTLSSTTLIDDTRRAIACGYVPKPVLVGPITYLALAKGVDGYDCWQSLDAVIGVYKEIVTQLDPLCRWIQIDEPILCADMSPVAREAFLQAYDVLNASVNSAGLLLTTYFDALDDNLDIAFASGCAGVHVDLTRGGANLDAYIEKLPSSMALSIGLIDGRNVWKTDYEKVLTKVNGSLDALPAERVLVGSSCSLLHSPVDLASETKLDEELKSWLAFAVQKCQEVSDVENLLSERSGTGRTEGVAILDRNTSAINSRRLSRRVHNPLVQERVSAIDEKMFCRQQPYEVRKNTQAWLDLPQYPTTTIGSFPQTSEIRAKRSAFKKGILTEENYEGFIKKEIQRVVKEQEALGLDILVHGEPERNDMVEYFGQQMDGFCFTSSGWVQSYGSRCVKPPIIYGDISRPNPMTVKWITYAASLTHKHMKGMLTGPVTILCWSFVRDDMERADVCRQLALAIRDEVKDLEDAKVKILQIDEAAFSEGMPIKQKDREKYLAWAVDCFRLSTSCVDDSTQIHSHMCYSEFNDIIGSIAAMDADVISIEASRSKMELLDAFKSFDYPNEIGPGIYDIHSPRVPTKEEMVQLLEDATAYIPKERLWVNPDCGLKTRDWPECIASLRNMVAAAHEMRKRG